MTGVGIRIVEADEKVSMHFTQKETRPRKKLPGLLVVVFLHMLVGGFFWAGDGGNDLEPSIQQPMDVKIINEDNPVPVIHEVPPSVLLPVKVPVLITPSTETLELKKPPKTTSLGFAKPTQLNFVLPEKRFVVPEEIESASVHLPPIANLNDCRLDKPAASKPNGFEDLDKVKIKEYPCK